MRLCEGMQATQCNSRVSTCFIRVTRDGTGVRPHGYGVCMTGRAARRVQEQETQGEQAARFQPMGSLHSTRARTTPADLYPINETYGYGEDRKRSGSHDELEESRT